MLDAGQNPFHSLTNVMAPQGKKRDLSFVRSLVRLIQNIRMGFVERDFTSLLGQFCVLAAVVLLFPPSQSKAKLIVDLGP